MREVSGSARTKSRVSKRPSRGRRSELRKARQGSIEDIYYGDVPTFIELPLAREPEHRGQHTVVVRSYDLVIVRRGLDRLPGQHRFSQVDLTREVLGAFSKRPWGNKLTQKEGS